MSSVISKAIKVLNIILIFNVICSITCCTNSSRSTLKIGTGTDVQVLLEVEDSKEIHKITFQAGDSLQTVLQSQLTSFDTILFSFDEEGEGTYKVCVYSINDTICTEQYVENGYRPKLKCTTNKIEVIDFF